MRRHTSSSTSAALTVLTPPSHLPLLSFQRALVLVGVASEFSRPITAPSPLLFSGVPNCTTVSLNSKLPSRKLLSEFVSTFVCSFLNRCRARMISGAWEPACSWLLAPRAASWASFHWQLFYELCQWCVHYHGSASLGVSLWGPHLVMTLLFL